MQKSNVDHNKLQDYTASHIHKINSIQGYNEWHTFTLSSMLHEKRGTATSVVNNQTQTNVDEKVGYGVALGAWYQLDIAIAIANPTSYKNLTQATIDVFYTPAQNLAFASEYTYGKREVFKGDEGKQSHLNLMAQYSF